MSKFRKKPVVVEAYNLVMNEKLPGWMHDAIKAGIVVVKEQYWAIHTLEGEMRADPTDWIIRGVKGEIYPCKPDIFEATYEACGDLGMSDERYHITYAEKRHPDAPDEYIIASDAQLTMYDHADELHMACEHAIAMMEGVRGHKSSLAVWLELRSVIYRCQGLTPPAVNVDVEAPKGLASSGTCPFCGNNTHFAVRGKQMLCIVCGAEGPDGRSGPDRRKGWNARYVEDAMHAELDAIPWSTFTTILMEHPVEYDILREWYNARAPQTERQWLADHMARETNNE